MTNGSQFHGGPGTFAGHVGSISPLDRSQEPSVAAEATPLFAM